MTKPLRVLNVEDSEQDAALLARHLKRAGFDLVSDRVDTAETLKAALESREWDLILCDYSMPQFDALAALALVKKTQLEIPFIIISGTVGETAAVEAMRAGAHDYLMKDNLARLGPTIERELLEAENRRARQRAEEELRFQKSLLESQSEASIDGILVVSKAGEILSFNKRLIELWDITEDLLRSRSDEAALEQVLEKLAAPAEFLDRVNYLYQHPQEESRDEIQLKDGRTLDRYSAPIKSGDDEYYGRVWFFRDITERKLAEEALRESEHRYRSLFENMIEGYAYCRMLFDHDTPHDFIYLEVNDKFEDLTGLKEVIGKRVSDVIPGFEETSPDLIKTYGRVALTGKPERLETYLESLGIWFSIAVYSPAKEHFIAIFDNITERKQAEVALRERLDLQDQLAQIAATSPGVLYSFRLLPDGSNCFPYASPAVADLFGLQASDLARDGSEVFARTHSEDIGQVQASIAESARTFLPWSNEFRFVHPDRGEIWIMASSVPQREPDGSILWRGFGMDTTERKRAEADVVRLAAAVEQTADSIVITDPEGSIQYVNPTFERITGYAKEEVLDKNPRLLKSGKTEPAVYKELWETITRGEVWAGQLTNRKKDGTLFEERVTISPVHDKNGRIVNYIAVKQDISDLIHLEDQLRQSQKMEAIGQLAGGVAHDFNNLLTAINGYSSLALQRIEGNPSVKNYLEEIKKAGDRAANLTRQLLAFGRKQILQPIPLSLNDVITDMNKMLRRLIGEDIELTANLDPALKKIKADPGQIEQVLVNLVVNARDAMPQGGNLTIETATVKLDQKYASKHVGVAPGNYVVLAVSDTGTGMDEETQTRIFDPFFTTKELGKGTGLGLSTVYGIVKQSGGNIWVYSELGHGSTFKIYLPQAVGQISQTESQTEAPASGGSETILLVEDEATVRGLSRQILEQVGYAVLEAGNGEEAINQCTAHSGRIDLLLTDVVMPRTSGKEVAEQVTSQRPAVKVLFMSGYTDEAIVHHGILDSNVEFIQKPFTPITLAKKVREVLDSD